MKPTSSPKVIVYQLGVAPKPEKTENPIQMKLEHNDHVVQAMLVNVNSFEKVVKNIGTSIKYLLLVGSEQTQLDKLYVEKLLNTYKLDKQNIIVDQLSSSLIIDIQKRLTKVLPSLIEQ